MTYFNTQKFRQLRKLKRMTIDDTALKARLHRVTLSGWERGVRKPSDKNIRALAHAIGESPSEFSDLQEEEISNAHLSDMVKSWLAFADANDNKREEQHNFFTNYLNKQYTEFRQASLVINAILSTMQSIFYVKDTNLQYITANDAFRKNFQLNPGYRVLGKTDEVFFAVKEAEKNSELDQKVLYSGKPIIKLKGYIPGSRKKKMGMISKLPIFDTDGKVAGLVSFFVDMTKEFKAEENRKILEATLTSSSDVVWLVTFSPKKKIIFASDSVKQLYGYPKDNFLNDYDFWWNRCVHPDDKVKITDYKHKDNMNSINGNISDDGTSTIVNQYRIIDAAGNIKWIEESIFKKKYLNKDCLCFIERDITEQYQAREIHQLITELFEKSEYYNIWLLKMIHLQCEPYFQKQYIYTSANSTIEKRYGYTKDAFSEDPMLWHKMLHPLDRDRIEAEIRDEQYPKTLRYRIVRPDGNIRWIEDYLISVSKDNNTYILGISKDLSDEMSNDAREFQLLVDTLKMLTAESSDIFWIKTFKMHYLLLEGSVEKILEIPKDSLLNSIDPFMDKVHPDDIEKLKNIYSGDVFPVTLEYKIKTEHNKYKSIKETIFKNEKYFYGIIKQ